MYVAVGYSREWNTQWLTMRRSQVMKYVKKGEQYRSTAEADCTTGCTFDHVRVDMPPRLEHLFLQILYRLMSDYEVTLVNDNSASSLASQFISSNKQM